METLLNKLRWFWSQPVNSRRELGLKIGKRLREISVSLLKEDNSPTEQDAQDGLALLAFELNEIKNCVESHK